MRPGDVIHGRFALNQLAASGGMGEVFQARDRATDDVVAVKVLREAAPEHHARFEREVRVLAQLQHPAIVRYVAHGVTEAGEAYLAMEWLEGEDLQRRLARGKLSVEETVLLAGGVAEALAAAHLQGVIHRDLKPSNLFLVNGMLGQVKVLDFGIARLGGLTRMTQTGMLLGTPFYMAPEQARGDAELTPRVDVFALGCVLFECLAGAQLFTGDHVMAVLAKILFAETPRISALRPDVPKGLDVLIQRMLAREPAERPRDGAALVGDVQALGEAFAPTEAIPSPWPASTHSPSLTGDELRVCSVMLIRSEQPVEFAVTQPASAMPAEQPLRKAAEACGGHFELLADGSIVVTIAGAGIATDRAAQAAQCALRLQALCMRRPIALCTGKGEITGGLPLGDAIDRAAKRIAALRASVVEAGSHAGVVAAIALDDVTAALLDARFDVRENDAGYWLHGEHDLAEKPRLLLGKPSPCVGRERELGTLATIFNVCLDEPQAQAVVVTAQAGVGKSRLAHEFTRAVRRRGEAVEIWVARGDSLRAGTAFGLLGQALRGACGIRDGEPLEKRQEKLRLRVERHVAPRDQKRVCEFLGEIIGTPFPQEGNPPLQAARQDAQLMSHQTRVAWEDFVRAECTAYPVVLILEDLHWGDAATVRFVDAVLRSLHDRPFMVLALARPEVDELFPKLWSERNVQAITLKELTQRASERLVRQILGDSVDAGTLERIVTRAGGHAFYLEELIRAAAERKGVTLPETVVAMVQSRIEALDSDTRRILRAASIFGEVFWAGGVQALLGAAGSVMKVSERLETLVERDIVQRRSDARFASEVEYVFRHALIRDAAYAMLTDGDRALGHRLAAEWLERASEGDPQVLAQCADHAEQFGRDLANAGDREGAAGGFIKAGLIRIRIAQLEAAVPAMVRGLDLADVKQHPASELLDWLCAISEAIQIVRSAPGLQGVLDRVLERIDVAGTPEQRVRAHVAGAIALGAIHVFEHAYLNLDRVREMASSSVELLREALIAEIHTTTRCGNFTRALRAVRDLDMLGSTDDPRVLCIVSWVLVATGDYAGALDSLRRAEALTDPADRLAAVERYKQLGVVQIYARNFSAAVDNCLRAVELARVAGLHHDLAVSSHNLAAATYHLGDYTRARAIMVESTGQAEAFGLRRVVSLNRMYLAYFDGLKGVPVDDELTSLLHDAERLGYQLDVLEGRALLAALLKHRGEHVKAKREYEQLLVLAEELGDRFHATDAREALRDLSQGAPNTPGDDCA